MVSFEVFFADLRYGQNLTVLRIICRYPVTLFNELYYLNSGGTVWTGTSLNMNLYSLHPQLLVLYSVLGFQKFIFGKVNA